MKKLKNEDILIKFGSIHKDKYDYSLVNYINYHKKVKIICKKHGVFEQTPANHISGQNCIYCSNKVKHQIDIIEEFIKINGNKYDYSLVKYTGDKEKVKIICKKHGIFETRPQIHKYGSDCPQCSNILDKETVIKQFNEIHNNLYDYSLIEYIGGKEKVKIICEEHGIFNQTPNSHKNGRGCNKCMLEKRYKDRKTFLYYLLINNTQYKVGICLKGNNASIQSAIKSRYHKEIKSGVNIQILDYELFMDGNLAYTKEQRIRIDYNFGIDKNKSLLIGGGHTEISMNNLLEDTLKDK